MIVIPTILERDFLLAEERFEKVRALSNWIQIDVIDGFFKPGKSFELELLTKIKGTESSLLDIHLMVKNPDNWIGKCLFVEGSRIVGQVEMMKDRENFVKNVKKEGLEVGLAFDLETEIDDQIPEETDVVLLLSRPAGFGKYQFDRKVFEKIEILKSIRKSKGLNFIIAIDGGIGINEAKQLKQTGVDVLYCGSDYFEVRETIND